MGDSRYEYQVDIAHLHDQILQPLETTLRTLQVFECHLPAPESEAVQDETEPLCVLEQQLLCTRYALLRSLY